MRLQPVLKEGVDMQKKLGTEKTVFKESKTQVITDLNNRKGGQKIIRTGSTVWGGETFRIRRGIQDKVKKSISKGKKKGGSGTP